MHDKNLHYKRNAAESIFLFCFSGWMCASKWKHYPAVWVGNVENVIGLFPCVERCLNYSNVNSKLLVVPAQCQFGHTEEHRAHPDI